MRMNSGIYQIENQINGNRYIGSAVDFRKRWAVHLCYLRHSTHYNSHLQSAFNKYGEIAFVFEILEEAIEPENLIEREQYYLDTLNPEYNILTTAGSMLGYRHSKEIMRKRSAAVRGKPHPHKGHRCSEDTKRKVSIAQMGRVASIEARQNMSKAHMGERNHNYGKHFNAKTRRKMREAWTPERRQAQSDKQRGKHYSEETKRRLSEALKAYWRKKRERTQEIL